MFNAVVNHEVSFIYDPHWLLALFARLSSSSNTILFMSRWLLFQNRCLFSARRHEYVEVIGHVEVSGTLKRVPKVASLRVAVGCGCATHNLGTSKADCPSSLHRAGHPSPQSV